MGNSILVYGKRFVILVLSFLFCQSMSSQTNPIVRGRVIDAVYKQPLEGASITAIRITDSIVIGKGFSDKSGEFNIQTLKKADSVLLQVSFSGYTPFLKMIKLQSLTQVGLISLSIETKELSGVTISALQPLMKIKKDTVEFQASAFKLDKNAMIEDLLRKIPGLVFDNGQWLYNGKKISRVLVDGREFFGSDPDIAIKNLAARIVEKVQISDTKSLEEVLLGLPPTSTDKTLNVKLKDQKHRSATISAGVGLKNRYEGGAIINSFKGPFKVSAFTGINNINKIGISLGHSGAVGYVDPGNGITRQFGNGINHNNKFGNFFFDGNYQFKINNTDKSLQKESRQYVLPDSSFYSLNLNSSMDKVMDHQLNVKVEKRDSVANFSFYGTFKKRSSDNVGETVLETTAQSGALINSSRNNLRSKNDQSSMETKVSYARTKIFGGFMLIDYSANVSLSIGNDLNSSFVRFPTATTADSTKTINQFIKNETTSQLHSFVVYYSRPINRYIRINLSNRLSVTKDEVIRTVLLADSGNLYTKTDSALSIATRFLNNLNLTRLSLAYTNKIWTGSMGISHIYNCQSNLVKTTSTFFVNSWNQILPFLDLQFAPNRYIKLKGNFSTRVTPPTPEKLQPVYDNINPVYIRVGNPDLKTTRAFFSSIGFDLFTKKELSMFANIHHRLEKNTITTKVTYDTFGRQVLQYVNFQGYSWDFSTGLSKFWRNKVAQKSISVSFSQSYANRLAYVNTVPVLVESWNTAPKLALQYNYNNLFDMNIVYAPMNATIVYKNADFERQNYLIHKLSVDAKISGPKNFQLTNSVHLHKNRALGKEGNALLWNLGVQYLPPKLKQGLVRFSVYDLLKQNNNLTRRIADNYIEDTQATILQRYFMLTCSFGLEFKK